MKEKKIVMAKITHTKGVRVKGVFERRRRTGTATTTAARCKKKVGFQRIYNTLLSKKQTHNQHNERWNHLLDLCHFLSLFFFSFSSFFILWICFEAQRGDIWEESGWMDRYAKSLGLDI